MCAAAKVAGQKDPASETPTDPKAADSRAAAVKEAAPKDVASTEAARTDTDVGNNLNSAPVTYLGSVICDEASTEDVAEAVESIRAQFKPQTGGSTQQQQQQQESIKGIR